MNKLYLVAHSIAKSKYFLVLEYKVIIQMPNNQLGFLLNLILIEKFVGNQFHYKLVPMIL